MTQSNNSLRRSIRQRRRNLPLQLKQEFDYAIHKSIISSGLLTRSSSIAGYLSNDGEPSIDLLSQSCTTYKLPYYLPVIHKQKLLFSPYSWGDKLALNKFNIPEPSTTHSYPTKFISTLLIPLVGYDTQGNRLGMGAGFYDRTLAFSSNKSCNKKPLLVGIAYSLQAVEGLMANPWDIPLDAVITENGLLCFSTKAKQLLRTKQTTNT
jgi:5-formyltetrahydrofolate cyclo-ligase